MKYPSQFSLIYVRPPNTLLNRQKQSPVVSIFHPEVLELSVGHLNHIKSILFDIFKLNIIDNHKVANCYITTDPICSAV